MPSMLCTSCMISFWKRSISRLVRSLMVSYSACVCRTSVSASAISDSIWCERPSPASPPTARIFLDRFASRADAAAWEFRKADSRAPIASRHCCSRRRMSRRGSSSCSPSRSDCSPSDREARSQVTPSWASPAARPRLKSLSALLPSCEKARPSSVMPVESALCLRTRRSAALWSADSCASRRPTYALSSSHCRSTTPSGTDPSDLPA
mmetsp:Transcript_23017/g.77231  ORF Transcript_23017/g.77231 Transcript_23017/m.77231 type:complete len:208 (-) Transcript_23017:228-851(-)